MFNDGEGGETATSIANVCRQIGLGVLFFVSVVGE